MNKPKRSTVGIISHVEELKMRIPVHIEVTKTTEGSQVDSENVKKNKQS